MKLKKLFNTLKWIINQSKGYKKHVVIITMLGGLFSICNVYRAITSKNLIDTAISGNGPQTAKYLGILAALIVLEICFSSTESLLSSGCQAKLGAKIQKKTYRHIINSKWLEQSGYHSGSLSARLSSDVDAVSNVIVNSIPNIISLTTLLVSSFICVLYLEPLVAIAAITISPVCIFFSRLYASKLKKIYKNYQEADAQCRSFIQESVQNLMVLKTFCLERKNSASLSELQDKKIKLTIKRSYISTLSNIVLRAGSWSTFFIVFWWGAGNLSKGINGFGTLTALLQLISSIQSPLYGLASTVPELVAAVGSSERLTELLSLPLEKDVTGDNALEDVDPMDSSFENSLCFPDDAPVDIEFENVNYSYKKEEPLLKNINFTIKAGETVGLIGSSGEGKTTIARLLLSLITPDKGQIYLRHKGKRIEVTPASRRMISYVPQGNTLFSGTIKSNLLYGDLNATESDIQKAAASSFAADFIEQLENKYETVIGEKGLGLSEGQAQRLAIARAFLRKKPILVLDEATSSLDAETEAKVLMSIQGLSHKPTCIIITHRLSALSICDRVFKLEDGLLYEIFSRSRALEKAPFRKKISQV